MRLRYIFEYGSHPFFLTKEAAVKLKQDWKNITNPKWLKGYVINSQGIVKNKRSNKIIVPYVFISKKTKSMRFVYHFRKKGAPTYTRVEELYEIVFNKKLWDVISQKQLLLLIKHLKDKNVKNNLTNKPYSPVKSLKTKQRRCHDCGRPTNNYRCSACWQKIRKKYGVTQQDQESYGILRI